MSHLPPPLPLPADPQHQRFADLRLDGKSLIEAYLGAGYKADSKSSSNAKRIEKRPDVIGYMEAVRQASARGSVLTLTEKREFFARVVRTPLTKINPNNPEDPNLDLVKKWKLKMHTEGRGDDAATYWTEEIEKLDPLKAIDLDNKLSGDDPEASLAQQLSEALRSITHDNPLPQGTL